MKYSSKLIGALILGVTVVTSCVDESLLPYEVPAKPGSLEDYEYLKEYDVLKSYVNRDAHPIFHVSAALDAADYAEGKAVARIANTNFDEIVAGNAMKMGSVVNDKGEFNWSTVQAFVTAAENNDMTIYGHTLAWHAQQPVKWLNKLIADKPKPVDPNAGGGSTTIVPEAVATVTYQDGPFPFYPMGSEPPVINGAIHFEPTGDWSQFFITNAIDLKEPGNYGAILRIKSSEEGTIKLTAQNGWSNQQVIDGNVKLSTDWTDVEVKFDGITCEPSSNYDFILKPETFMGVIDLESLTIVRYKEVAGPTTVTEDKEIAEITYNDGPFPFYPMGCEPPVIDGALHFEPTGDWSQFFITNAINLGEPGDFSAILTIKSSEEGTIKLTAQNGWSDQQVIDGNVKLSTDWTDVEVKFDGITCEPSSNYDFILKPETFMGVIDLKKLKIVQHITKTVGGDGPQYVDVWTNELINSELDPSKSTESFIVRDAVSNDDPAVVQVGAGPDGKNAIIVKGKTNPAEEWDTQFFVYTPNKQWEAGEKYRFSMWYKATKAIGTDTQVHGTPGGYIYWQMLSPNPSFTTEWQYKEWEGSIPADGGGNQQTIAFNLNKNKSDDPGTQIDYYFSDIQWQSYSQVEVPKTELVHVDFVKNSDMEGDDASSFVRKENNGPFENVITPGIGKDGSRGVSVTSNAGAAEDWDTQFWIKLNDGMWLESGQKVTVEFDYKASTSASGDTQAHANPGEYQHWACIGTVNFTTEWQHYKYDLTVDGSMAGANGLGSIAFNLSKDRGQQVTYYFDNISVWSEEEVEIKSTVPLTDEEKRDTLTYAMKLWIDGMMKATEGKVKSWDLINEAIGQDRNKQVNGHYDLQHASEDKPNDFYWQDYFGSEEYGVIMEKLAREAYAEQEGANPADLKLFINDYNLEATWDDNKKLKDLIYWIGVWEEKGAKIDGIGTQMHISYYRNAADQENQKKHITDMLELMAKTEKLVRISELDMGVCDKMFGDPIDKTEITLADEKAMADYYQWIIEEYFRIVPPAQQYGICQWCLTDATGKVTDTGGWRPGQPVGLWYLDWTRKPAYAGWAEGLQK